MAVIQDININVHGQPSEKRLQTFLRLSQNENGRSINFRVLGAPLPSGCTATFAGTKPDGNVYSTTGTVTGNFVIVQEDMQMTAVAGVWDAKLDIINGTHNIMTALIRVVVDADVVDPDAIASDSQLQGLVAEAKHYAEQAREEAYGSPLTATTKAAMTDKTRVYVYTGSESGMTAGNWYSWNGSAWVSGGVYNAVAVQTDTTLTLPGVPADAKETGDKISAVKEDLNDIRVGADGTTYETAGAAVRGQISNLNRALTLEETARQNADSVLRSSITAEEARAKVEEKRLEDLFSAPTQDAVNQWLNDHPEATTTVQDASLTEAKFTEALKVKTIKDYVTPEMFGAIGDGITDDSLAIQAAIDSGKAVELIAGKEYLFGSTLLVSNPLIFDGHYAKMKYTGSDIGINFNAASLPSHKRDFGFITHLFLSAPLAEKAINFKQPIKTVFDGIKIYDFAKYGFYFEAPGYETYITNVWLVAKKSVQITYGFYGGISDMTLGNLFGLNVSHFLEVTGGGYNINYIHAWCANYSILDDEPAMTEVEYEEWFSNTVLLSFISESGQVWPNRIGYVYADTYYTAIYWASYNRYNNIGFMLVRKCTNFFVYGQGKGQYSQYLSIDNCNIDPAAVSVLSYYPTIKAINGLNYVKAAEVDVSGDIVTCPENQITKFTKQFTSSFDFVISNVEQLPILLNDGSYGDVEKIRIPYKGSGSRHITASSGTPPASTYYATFFLRPEKFLNSTQFKYVRSDGLND